jgi:hypothetical protein
MLQENAKYIGKKVGEIAGNAQKVVQGESDRLSEVRREIKRVNEDRRTGIWIEKMKKAAFG